MKSRKFLGVIITTIVVVMILTANHILGLRIGEKVTGILAPVAVVISTTGQQISTFFGNIAHIGTLQTENKELSNKLDSALTEIARLTEAKKENDSLRADLGFKQNSSLSLVPGEVAYFDPGLRDGITVKVSDSAGIKVGSVVTAQGYLIGRVATIDGKNIRVLLITDSTSSIPVTLESKDISGIAKGKIGNGLTMERVPQSDNVVKDDIVITSGLGGDVPKGLILGKVSEVQKVSGSIFQGVVLQPLIQFTSIERVMIAR